MEASAGEGYGDGAVPLQGLHLHEQSGSYYHPTMLRVMPWATTVLSANFLHYSSLLQVRSEARNSAMECPPPLSFNLMDCSSMRLVRYKIKLLRYSATLIFLVLFWASIPEIHQAFYPGWGTVEAFIVGLLAGFISIYLNENKAQDMRTPWNPSLDFQSTSYGCIWDLVRLAGGSLLVPFEEELFYHSWLYRYFCLLLSPDGLYETFEEVPLHRWSWWAWIASNGVLALYNGQEWRSYGFSGLLSNWVICRRGQFMDGIIAHAIHNLVVSFWVLSTGQRQYW